MLILFDILLLVDKAKLRQIYADGICIIMQERYGLAKNDWCSAHTQIIRDWDDYFADLNFSGDDGFADFREGYFRVTRALFRITNTTEPDKSELHKLSRELLTKAPTYGDALTDEAKETIQAARQNGFQLAVMTYLTADNARGVLQGAEVDEHFRYVIGFDSFEKFERDRHFYRSLARYFKVDADNRLIVATENVFVSFNNEFMQFYSGKISDLPTMIETLR